MNDLQALELAAKAIGYMVNVIEHDGDTRLQIFDPNDESGQELDWNPYYSDADAFRLMVKL